MIRKLTGRALYSAERVDALKPAIDPLLVQLVMTDDFCRRGQLLQAAEHLYTLTKVYAGQPAQIERIARHSLLMVEHSSRFPAQLGSMIDNAPLLQVALQYAAVGTETYERAHALLVQSIDNAEAKHSPKTATDLAKLYTVLSIGTANPAVREQAESKLANLASKPSKLTRHVKSAAASQKL